MFEDTKQEPEDMFDATDKVAPQVASPTNQTSIQSTVPVTPQTPSFAPAVDPASSSVPPVDGGLEEPVTMVSQSSEGFPWKIVLLIVGILVVIGAAFFLSVRILGSQTPVTPQPPEVVLETEEEAIKAEVPTEEPEEVMEKKEEEVPISRTDTDKDGLTDVEEAEYGTSPRAADTDSDGLFDREEILTWETDPLDPDTDGDGYLDGEEVDGGYNPKGPGQLREVPSESN